LTFSSHCVVSASSLSSAAISAPGLHAVVDGLLELGHQGRVGEGQAVERLDLLLHFLGRAVGSGGGQLQVGLQQRDQRVEARHS
jgi:hypothetical protein